MKHILDFSVLGITVVMIVAVGMKLEVGQFLEVVRCKRLIAWISVATLWAIFQAYHLVLKATFEFAVPTNTLGVRITTLATLSVLAGIGLRRFASWFVESPLLQSHMYWDHEPGGGCNAGFPTGEFAGWKVGVTVRFIERNTKSAMPIAITLLNRVQYAVFSAVCWLTEAPLVLMAVTPRPITLDKTTSRTGRVCPPAIL